VAAAALLAAAPVLGQPSDQVRAKRLVVEGRRALRAASYQAALKHLAAAFELDPQPAVAYDLAMCHRALAQYDSAISYFRKFLELRGPKLKKWERTRVETLIAEVERSRCRLVVDVEPAGAEVTVDGQRAGTAPLPGPLAVNPGRRLIEVSLEGYASVAQTAEVVGGQTLVVSIKLERRTVSGLLIVVSPAPGATAVIGTGAVQPLPLSTGLAEGEYLVKVAAPNHHSQERTVSVAAGSVIRVEVTLAPVLEPARVAEPPAPGPPPVDLPPPVYRRAWFWVTLAAVAVAGGATGGYFGYRSRTGDSFDRSLRLR
jgi:hypothetical protein